MSVRVLVDSVEKIKQFVSITNSSKYDLDLIAGKDTYLDAKSLMGILSCNIEEPMTLVINCDDDSEKQRLKDDLERFIV